MTSLGGGLKASEITPEGEKKELAPLPPPPSDRAMAFLELLTIRIALEAAVYARNKAGAEGATDEEKQLAEDLSPLFAFEPLFAEG